MINKDFAIHAIQAHKKFKQFLSSGRSKGAIARKNHGQLSKKVPDEQKGQHVIFDRLDQEILAT